MPIISLLTLFSSTILPVGSCNLSGPWPGCDKAKIQAMSTISYVYTTYIMKKEEFAVLDV